MVTVHVFPYLVFSFFIITYIKAWKIAPNLKLFYLLSEAEPLEYSQLFNMYYSIDACGARLEPVLNPQLAMLLPVNVPRYNDPPDSVENTDGYIIETFSKVVIEEKQYERWLKP